MATRLILIRHGLTEWNIQGIEQGWLDSTLTETGVELARRVALRLQGVPVAAFYCSPLGRARQTADIIATTIGMQPRPDERLKELGLGSWEGRAERDILREYNLNHNEVNRDPDSTYALRGGERYSDLLKRTADFLKDMADVDGIVVAVTHGGTLRAFRQNVLGILTERSQVSVASCCINQVNYTGGAPELMLFNDYYHHDASIYQYWHGSQQGDLTELSAGSTITRIRPLAEAFSHRPSMVGIDTDSSIMHNGETQGYLYTIDEPIEPGDVYQHPRTNMPVSYELLTNRPLRMKLIAELPPHAPLTRTALDPKLTSGA